MSSREKRQKPEERERDKRKCHVEEKSRMKQERGETVTLWIEAFANTSSANCGCQAKREKMRSHTKEERKNTLNSDDQILILP